MRREVGDPNVDRSPTRFALVHLPHLSHDLFQVVTRRPMQGGQNGLRIIAKRLLKRIAFDFLNLRVRKGWLRAVSPQNIELKLKDHGAVSNGVERGVPNNL